MAEDSTGVAGVTGVTQETEANPPASHKWIKLVVAVWTVRMAMMAAGVALPMIVGLISMVPQSRLHARYIHSNYSLGISN